MLDRLIDCLRVLVLAVVTGALLSSCGSPAKPSVVTPPSDPPTISCPAAATEPSVDGNPVPVTYADPTVTGGQSPLTVACTPVSGAMFPVGATSVSCTVTDAQRRTATCPFTVTVVVPPKPVISVTNFVAFGDSITWGENGLNSTAQSVVRSHPAVQFPLFQTYPGALQQMLTARYSTQSPRVDNAGLKGEAVTDPSTLPRFSQTIARGVYDVVLIMEGANDLANRDATVEPAVISGLRQMILDAKSRSLRAFLATIPPEQHGCCPDRGLANTLVPGFNDQVRGLAFEQGVPLVDVYAALDGDVSTYIGPDGLHPTAAGYAKIAETFFGVIEQTLEVKQTITPTGIGGSRARPGVPVVPAPSSRLSQPVPHKTR